MKCQYINLDSATSRRMAMEDMFSRLNLRDWKVERVAAFNVNHVREQKIPGQLRDPEKACFLSHMAVLFNNLDLNDTIWIMEDDVKIADKTIDLIEIALNKILKNVAWDILFTDVGIPNIAVMSQLVLLRHAILENQSIECLNLNGWPFFGATSYIVNPKSIKKIFDLGNSTQLDIPIDLLYRKLAGEGKLNAYVTFPYLTTDSAEATVSQIQTAKTAQFDIVSSWFRKLTWIDGDNFDPTPMLNEMLQGVDKKSRIYGALWAIMANPHFMKNSDAERGS